MLNKAQNHSCIFQCHTKVFWTRFNHTCCLVINIYIIYLNVSCQLFGTSHMKHLDSNLMVKQNDFTTGVSYPTAHIQLQSHARAKTTRTQHQHSHATQTPINWREWDAYSSYMQTSKGHPAHTTICLIFWICCLSVTHYIHWLRPCSGAESVKEGRILQKRKNVRTRLTLSLLPNDIFWVCCSNVIKKKKTLSPGNSFQLEIKCIHRLKIWTIPSPIFKLWCFNDVYMNQQLRSSAHIRLKIVKSIITLILFWYHVY